MSSEISDKEKDRFTSLANAAIANYAVEVTSISFLSKSDGVLFCIETIDPKSKYVLRIHNDVGEYRSSIYHQNDIIESYLLWLYALDRDTDITVQKPVKNRANHWVTEIPSDRSNESIKCTLLKWIESDIISPHTEATVSQVGRLMAKMHNHASAWDKPDSFVRPLYDTNRFRQGLSELSIRAPEILFTGNVEHVLNEVVDRLHLLLDELGREKKYWGPIHGDLGWEGNVVFCQDKACPIDFNGCSIGHYLCDIAWAFCYISASLRPSFLLSYQQERALTDKSKRVIEIFGVGIGILLLAGWSKNNPKQLERLPAFVEGPCKAYLNDDLCISKPW